VYHKTSVTMNVKGFSSMGMADMWSFLLVYTAGWNYIKKKIHIIHSQGKTAEKIFALFASLHL